MEKVTCELGPWRVSQSLREEGILQGREEARKGRKIGEKDSVWIKGTGFLFPAYQDDLS